jgi:hypothetical protein
MLEYSEYKDVVDILSRTNHENTYEDLMSKEGKVLDTVNAVVKSYRDRQIKNIEMINRPIAENISRFWLDMNLMIKEIMDIKDFSSLPSVLTKGDRIIYIGALMIAFAVILFFVEISK